MSLTVTVLGSSGTYAGANSACTGFLVRSGTTTVMMDAGPGTLANLQRHVELTDLDAILLSHCHPDHWLELPVMRNACKYVLQAPPIDLYLTAETLQMAQALVPDGLEPTFRVHVIDASSVFVIGDLSVCCSLTDHPVETLAFRIGGDGRSLGYSSDTGPGWSLAELGEPVDLAICEATFLDGGEGETPVHLSARRAGEDARAAGVGHLVLTHLLPGSSPAEAAAEAAAAYGAPVDVAEMHRSFVV